MHTLSSPSLPLSLSLDQLWAQAERVLSDGERLELQSIAGQVPHYQACVRDAEDVCLVLAQTDTPAAALRQMIDQLQSAKE